MTKEEAKALLLNISAYDIDTQRGMKKQEAIEMAIKALEQEPCDKCVYSTSEGCQYDDITEAIPPFETSEDAVNRQAALNSLIDNTSLEGYDLAEALDAIENKEKLPPVTPQPKTGHWVEEIISVGTRKVFCSECGCSAPFEHVSNGDVYSASGCGVINKTKFCPNCGTKMLEPQESEDKE